MLVILWNDYLIRCAYIVIEHWVTVTELLQIEESIVGTEVLELNHELGECGGHLVHEFFHELSHDLS